MSNWHHTDPRYAQVDPEIVAVSDAKSKQSAPVPDHLEPKALRAAYLNGVK